MTEPNDLDQMLLPPYPIHPGPWLYEELEIRDLTIEWLSDKTGRPLQEILDVVEERVLISEDFARELEQVLGTDAQTWINANEIYLLTQERDRRRQARRRSVAAAD